MDWENLAEKKKAYKYPGVAAEVLSVMNDKTINYFCQANAEGQLPNVDRLLSFFEQSRSREGGAELNYTRASYVCKVLSGLLLEKTATVSAYLFKKRAAAGEDPFPAIIGCCQSKSVSGFVLSAITMLPTAQQLPISMGGNPMIMENKSEATNQNQQAVAKASFNMRLGIFSDVIDQCIQTQSAPALSDLHGNLANIVMIVINKDFPEQAQFMKVLFGKLPAVVDSFCETFNAFVNNKLGNIYLVLLEVLLKELAQKPAVATAIPAPVPEITKKYFELISSYFDDVRPAGKQLVLTPSFSREIKRLNPKIYKVMEALIVTLKTQTNTDQLDNQVVNESGFQRSVFLFFEAYPFNNILHNQIKKFLLILIEKGSDEVLNTFFGDNPHFYAFLDRLAKNRYIEPAGKARIKTGYVGHLVTLTATIIQRGGPLLEKLSQSELIRRELDQVPGRVLRERVRAGVPRAGRHRVPLGPGGRQPGQLRLHPGRHKAAPRHLPQLPDFQRGTRRARGAPRRTEAGTPPGTPVLAGQEGVRGAKPGGGAKGHRRQHGARVEPAGGHVHCVRLPGLQLLEAGRRLQRRRTDFRGQK